MGDEQQWAMLEELWPSRFTNLDEDERDQHIQKNILTIFEKEEARLEACSSIEKFEWLGKEWKTFWASARAQMTFKAVQHQHSWMSQFQAVQESPLITPETRLEDFWDQYDHWSQKPPDQVWLYAWLRHQIDSLQYFVGQQWGVQEKPDLKWPVLVGLDKAFQEAPEEWRGVLLSQWERTLAERSNGWIGKNHKGARVPYSKWARMSVQLKENTLVDGKLWHDIQEQWEKWRDQGYAFILFPSKELEKALRQGQDVASMIHLKNTIGEWSMEEIKAYQRFRRDSRSLLAYHDVMPWSRVLNVSRSDEEILGQWEVQEKRILAAGDFSGRLDCFRAMMELVCDPHAEWMMEIFKRPKVHEYWWKKLKTIMDHKEIPELLNELLHQRFDNMGPLHNIYGPNPGHAWRGNVEKIFMLGWFRSTLEMPDNQWEDTKEIWVQGLQKEWSNLNTILMACDKRLAEAPQQPSRLTNPPFH